MRAGLLHKSGRPGVAGQLGAWGALSWIGRAPFAGGRAPSSFPSLNCEVAARPRRQRAATLQFREGKGGRQGQGMLGAQNAAGLTLCLVCVGPCGCRAGLPLWLLLLRCGVLWWAGLVWAGLCWAVPCRLSWAGLGCSVLCCVVLGCAGLGLGCAGLIWAGLGCCLLPAACLCIVCACVLWVCLCVLVCACVCYVWCVVCVACLC